MASEYYLKSGDQKLGPFSEAQISEGLSSGKISLFDFIFNKQSNSWVMLMAHPDFCDTEYRPESAVQDEEDAELKEQTMTFGLLGQNFSVKTEAPVENEIVPEIGKSYWFEKSNPAKSYKFLDVVSLIHKGIFTEQTLVSTTAQGPWQPIIDWEDFSPLSLSQFKRVATEEVPEVHIRRRHPRFDLGKVFIFFVYGNAFKAFCPDISKYGLSFVVQSHKAEIDDEVYVKFSDDISDQTFDAKAVVVGFRKIRVADSGKIYIRYSLRFTHFSESGKTKLLDWTRGV